ncbi:MAG: hypothetical protein HKN48_05880 [Flavobacteriaceae bacterium]|nr:hypothetical protein [Flavobacteriaceae bacterium]
MKKSLIFLTALLVFNFSHAQDKLYLIVELMKVDNTQESDYNETEAFWEKIHQQRANNGNIIGWDLWRLMPGGENQGHQYAVVTLFNNKTAMFKGGGLWEAAKAAYPNMSENELDKKLNSAADTRDLAVRIYMEMIAATEDDFEIDVGTVATFDWMKVELGKYSKYEKAEMEVFMPGHQRMVDAGAKGSWSLLRFISPIGSDTYSSHLTVNMFKDFDQMFANYEGDGSEMTAAQQKAVEDGLALRDMKFVTIGQLDRKVRKK